MKISRITLSGAVCLRLALPLLSLIALSMNAFAELPKKAPITHYAGLWVNSPFTSKPPPVIQGPESNPLEDYALGGVSPIPGGYRVTLINKKKPEEHIVMPDDPDFPEFKILSVEYGKSDPLKETSVRVAAGAKQGTVKFDENLLKLKVSAPAPPQQNPNGQPPGIPGGVPPNPGAMPNNGQPNNGVPPPRPRVVAAPQPGASPTPNIPQQQRTNNLPQRRPVR